MRRTTSAVVAGAAACLASLTSAGHAAAQESAPRLVLRADVVAARATSAQLAAGATLPLGNDVRLDAVAGAGVTRGDGDTRGSARADVVARFLLDPFLQSSRGVYGGAGVSALHDAVDDGWRGYLVAVVGVEGRPRGRFIPALEIGLGSGARAGVVLRGARRGRR